MKTLAERDPSVHLFLKFCFIKLTVERFTCVYKKKQIPDSLLEAKEIFRMDGLVECGIDCQEVTVKNKKRKNPASKIFKYLLFCVFNGLHAHMLSANEEKTEFEVKLRDKKNRREWKEKDISLFADLDSVSSKCREKKKYAEKTKNRFKSNMTKLVNAKCLEYLGERKEPKSIVIRKYKILKYPVGMEEIAVVQKKTDQKFIECSSKSITRSYETLVQNTFNSGAVSDYSCLSGEHSKINFVENAPFVKTENVENHNVSLGENVSFVNIGNVGNHNVSLGENVSLVNTGKMKKCNVRLGGNVSFVNTRNVENCNVSLGENVSLVNTGNVGNHNVSLGENVCLMNTGNVGNHNVSLGEIVSLVNTGNVGNHNVSLGEKVSFVNTGNVENHNLYDFRRSNELDAFKNEIILPGSLIPNQDFPDFSFLDDNTLFGETEKNDYNLMDPFLSSAMEPDESPGLSPTSDWHSDSQVFELEYVGFHV